MQLALTSLKHSLPAIRGKHKRTERLGSLTKRYRSAGGALTKRNRSAQGRRTRPVARDWGY